jgi:hypothetical protein
VLGSQSGIDSVGINSRASESPNTKKGKDALSFENFTMSMNNSNKNISGPSDLSRDRRILKQISVVNKIMVAKSRFMAVVRRNRLARKREYKITKKRMKSIEEWQKDKIENKLQKKKEHEKICHEIIDKSNTLKGLSPIIK